MSYENTESYLKYKNLRNQLKNDLLSFIETEFESYSSDYDHNQFLLKKIKLFEKIFLNLDYWMKSTIPEKYKQIVIRSISQKKWSNIIEAFKEELYFGTSDDLSIYHDGSNSYIREAGTGNLFIEASDNIYFPLLVGIFIFRISIGKTGLTERFRG